MISVRRKIIHAYFYESIYVQIFNITLFKNELSYKKMSSHTFFSLLSFARETILFWFALRFSTYVISVCLLSTSLYSLSEDCLAINQTYIYIHICIVLHVMIIFTISNVLWMVNKIFCVLQLFIYTFTNDRYSGRIKVKILFRMQFINLYFIP